MSDGPSNDNTSCVRGEIASRDSPNAGNVVVAQGTSSTRESDLSFLCDAWDWAEFSRVRGLDVSATPSICEDWLSQGLVTQNRRVLWVRIIP